MSSPAKLPRWAELGLLPLINLLAALVLSGVVVSILGESPWAACKLMLSGSLGTTATRSAASRPFTCWTRVRANQ